VEWWVRGNGGSGGLRSIAQAGVAGFGQMSETELLRLGFGCTGGNGGRGRWGDVVG
jgi:hypothetical protein